MKGQISTIPSIRGMSKSFSTGRFGGLHPYISFGPNCSKTGRTSDYRTGWNRSTASNTMCWRRFCPNYRASRMCVGMSLENATACAAISAGLVCRAVGPTILKLSHFESSSRRKEIGYTSRERLYVKRLLYSERWRHSCGPLMLFPSEETRSFAMPEFE